MIRLTLLAGLHPGETWLFRRFPVSIGRGPGADLVLEEDGVWARHATLRLDQTGRFHLAAESGAILIVNGLAAAQADLENGDILELGAAKLRFALSETRLRSQRAREWATWIAVGLLCVGQLLLIYYVMP